MHASRPQTLLVIVVVVALDRGLLDCPVPLPGNGLPANRERDAFDLAAIQENSPPDCFLIFMAPRVVRFGQAVLDLVCVADHVEAALPRIDRVAVAGLLGDLDAVVRCPASVCLQTLRGGQDRVQLVRNDDQHFFQELDGGAPCRLVIELHDGKFRRAINGYEQVEPIAGKTIPRIDFWPGSYLTAAHLGDVPSRGLPANHCRATDMEEAPSR